MKRRRKLYKNLDIRNTFEKIIEDNAKNFCLFSPKLVTFSTNFKLLSLFGHTLVLKVHRDRGS